MQLSHLDSSTLPCRVALASIVVCATGPDMLAHSNVLLAARTLYARVVAWMAPVRNILRSCRAEVIRHLLRETGGMHNPYFACLRRSQSDYQMIGEFAARFVFGGEEIDQAPGSSGDVVELKRVRILDLVAGRVITETCIENWTILQQRK